jgi:nicotinate-nucleotide adenylyltransferase
VKTGLLFGSFNPVHTGHLIVAEHFVSHHLVDEMWLVVSPHNPFKAQAALADPARRVHMARLAAGDNPLIRVCDAELFLPTPSYTAHTMRHLVAAHPDREFVLVIGDDLVADFPKWKDADWLLDHFPVYVFPRTVEPGAFDRDEFGGARMRHVNAPRIGISSTLIRNLVAEGRSIRYLVPESVREYILSEGLYHQ